MEADILKTAGEVAGIGGLAVGALVIVFRDIVLKSIFPKLSQERAYRLLLTIVGGVWSIAVIGIATWIYARSVAPDGARADRSRPETSVTANCGVAINGAVAGSTINNASGSNCAGK